MRTDGGSRPERGRRTRRTSVLLAMTVAGLLAAAGGLEAQNLERFRAGCEAGAPPDTPQALVVPCGQVGLLAQAVQAGVGLAQSGGGSLVGSSSSLGRRFGATPRVAVTGRIGVTRFPLPDLSSTALGGGKVTATSFHLGVVAGVFDGFSPAPTVGGLLSLDLLAAGDLVLLPEDRGFQDAATAWGYGLRLGLLRESFTLPGVTLSVTRRHGGSVDARPAGDGGPGVDLDVVTTSLRGVVGKDLMGFGVLGGLGWDRYGSDGSVTRRGLFNEPLSTVTLQVDDFESDRFLVYGGVSRTYLILQFAAEVGWAQGVGDPDPALTGYAPGDASFFGTVSLRLTF